MGGVGAQALRAMSTRWVLHVDLDQFQAAVEVRRNPDLAGLPVIVGGNGDPSEPRKVVTCASYPAREFGVHAGMPLRTAARKCPDATFLPLDTDAYDEASEEVMGLLRDFGHPVEVWGWDEAYVGADVDDPVHLAEQIREVVAAGTGLSCSVGISDNKQRAKVATGFGKPAGIYALTEDNWMAVMGDREVDALWGVGPKTAKKLAGMGITTVADLASTDAQLLTSTFGPTTGLWILLLAKGGGDTDVSAEPWVPRSRSHVITFPRDLTDRAEIDSAVVELANQTLEEIVGQGRVVTRVAVTVRTKTFFTRTKIRKLPSVSTDAETITRTALELLGQFELDRPVRLLGVRLELAPPDGEHPRRAFRSAGRRRDPVLGFRRALATVQRFQNVSTVRTARATRPRRWPQRAREEDVDLPHRQAVGPPHRSLQQVQRPDVGRRVNQESITAHAPKDPVRDVFG